MFKVIMFHTIGSNKLSWKSPNLSVDARQFEAFCKYLHSNKYKTFFLDYWYFLENNPEKKTNKDLFLTFDDGYLDNLLVAYPVMKKYSIKGTIFINPEFIDPSEGIRTLETYPSTLGYLNWDEVIFLDSTNVFDIQSHSMSHNFFFSSDKLIDIHDGTNKYHWLAWISRPDRKPFWQVEDQGSFTEKGYPVFESYRALGLRRYFPDKRLVDYSIKLYNEKKPKEYILKKLQSLLNDYPGRYETDEELVARYRYELEDSKRILEQKLNKKIEFLCWPGGGYNELSLSISEEVGYKASTIASRDRAKHYNNNKVYKRIARMGMDSTLRIGGYLKASRTIQTSFPYHLIWQLKSQENKGLIYFLVRLNNLILKFF